MADTTPLWQTMRNAYDQSSAPNDMIENSDPETGDCLTDRYGYAAELRAIADWISDHYSEVSNTSTDPVADVINGLCIEADQAEVDCDSGDIEPPAGAGGGSS